MLSGHEHSYERLTVDGVPYVVNGSGGRELRPEMSQEHEDSVVFYGEDYGALFVKGCASHLSFQFQSVSEGTVDQFTLGRDTC